MRPRRTAPGSNGSSGEGRPLQRVPRRLGEDARESFKHVYIFGTDETPGSGFREDVSSWWSPNKPSRWTTWGAATSDPWFFVSDKLFEPKPFAKEHVDRIERLARGIILTDDYAPVENLLAPVAETRGKED